MPNANAIANVFKLIEENDIKFALLRFTDIKGKEHGVSIPVSLVDEDMFEDGKMFDGSSVEGWKTINKADMLLMPIAETAVVDPFAQIPTLSIRCSVYEPTTMQSYDRDPRSIAIRAENYMRSTGVADQAWILHFTNPLECWANLRRSNYPQLKSPAEYGFSQVLTGEIGRASCRERV